MNEGFVHKGAKVAILPNAQSKNPGTHTKPEIIRAVVKMCLDAGLGRDAMIGHTQPRRLAARSIGSRFAEEGGTPLGNPRRKDEDPFGTHSALVQTSHGAFGASS